MNPRCSICLENFTVNCNVRSPPCGHTFHDRCILLSFRSKPECPICRQQGTALFPVRLDFSSSSGSSNTSTATKKKQQGETTKMNQSKCEKGSKCSIKRPHKAESGNYPTRSVARPQQTESRCARNSQSSYCAVRPQPSTSSCSSFSGTSSCAARPRQSTGNFSTLSASSSCAARSQQTENTCFSTQATSCAARPPAQSACSSSRSSYCVARPQLVESQYSFSGNGYCSGSSQQSGSHCSTYRSSYCSRSTPSMTSCVNRNMQFHRFNTGEVDFLSRDFFDLDL